MSRIRWSAVACVALFTSTLALAQDVPPITRVLLLYEHAPESRSIAAFTFALRSAVAAETSAHVEYREEFLDFARFPDRARAPTLVRVIAEQYRTAEPDVIVAEGSAARQFATERLAAAYPGVPIVFALSAEPASSSALLPPNVTGRFATPPYATTLEMARRLQPDARRVVVLGGASPADSLGVENVVNELSRVRGDLPVDAIHGLSPNNLLAKVRRLPKQTIVVLASFTDDELGVADSAKSLVRAITRESAAPVYASLDSWLGQGVVGGAMLRFAEEGTRTARLVMRVLQRVGGEPMPRAEMAEAPLVADWRELQRWELTASTLTPDTELVFQTATLWERRRALIALGGGFVMAESFLLVLFAWERRRRSRGVVAAAIQIAEAKAIFDAIVADDSRAGEVVERIRAFLRSGTPVSVPVTPNDPQRQTVRLPARDAIMRHMRPASTPK